MQDQQLMARANFGAIHSQPNFTMMGKLCFQPLSSDRRIPIPNLGCRIAQEPAQSVN